MKISNLVQATLLMVFSAIWLAPTTATAAVTLSIKEGPEKSVGHGEDGGKGSFSFVVDASGWKTFSYEPGDGKDSLAFAGTYLSAKGKESQGTLYAWVVDAAQPSMVSDKLTIKFETDDKGLTQIEGSFQSRSLRNTP